MPSADGTMTVPVDVPESTGLSGSVSPAAWGDRLTKSYGRQHAVRGVSLRVGRGEVVGLLGANGAGKTTLIKMLLGVVRPDSGEVMLLGRSGSDPAARARVGYLPELFRYQPWLTATEVLDLHSRLCGLRPDARRRAELLETVGLAARARDRVAGFSKGMQQRLGLAVALVGDPEFVVLDEPTSALDPVGRADVRDLVLSLRDRGVAVLLNSHLIGEVERVCDRVVILDSGRVAAEGTLAQLLGQRRITLRLAGLTSAARARLAQAGEIVEEPGLVHIALAPAAPGAGLGLESKHGHEDADVDRAVATLVTDLVAAGVQIFSVEQGRMSLEDRLLKILRGHADAVGTPARETS